MSMHPTRNLFKEFPNRVFFETGTFRGDGVQLAIDAGFEKIYTMDIDASHASFLRSRFQIKDFDELLMSKHEEEFLFADSAEYLYYAISKIKVPITFWLDAHAQHLEDEPEFRNPYPLLKELEQIARHPIKTHTILIDDILHLTHPDITGWTRETIESALKAINPEYKFTYFANPVKNNILVAHV